MGIWTPTHTVTPTNVSPDLGEVAEILICVGEQTTSVHYGWGCKTFQTASHIHDIHIKVVWGPSAVRVWHMDAHTHHFPHKQFPIWKRADWNSELWSVQIMPLCYGWGCTASHIHCILIQGVWEHFIVVLDGYMDAHSHLFPHKRLPRCWLKSKRCLYVMAEAVHPFKLHLTSMSYIYKVFQHFFCDRWAYRSPLTLLPPHAFPQIRESWLNNLVLVGVGEYIYKVFEQPYKVFEQFLLLWFAIWMFAHSVTSTSTRVSQVWKIRLKS